MRARNIKPAFFQNELLTDIDFAGRLLFIGLWTLADREGRLEDRPKRIKMQLFAMDDVDVDGYLSELTRLGFIERYGRDGVQYIQIVNFTKHQRPHNNESQSVIPPSIEDTTANHGEQDVQPRDEALRSERYNTESPFTESLNTDTGNLNPDIATEVAVKTPPKPRPVPKPKREYQRNETWDALADRCGDPQTDSEKSDFGLTVKELDAIGATPGEIDAFGPWWWQTYPDMSLTHRCYRKHFGRFRTQPDRPALPSDIKNPGIRALIDTTPEEYDAIRRDVQQKNGRSLGIVADPRRLGDGGQASQPNVLPHSARSQRG